MSCKKFYDDMLVTRDYWVSRARRSAALTIPYLIPRSNEPVQENMDTYVLPWNGIGARGTTNLASKLLMALLPPTEAFFRFTVDPVAMEEQEVAMQEQGASDDEIAELKSNMELALNKLELSVLRSIETSNDRVVLHEALLQLIVAGNCMLYISEDGMKVYHLWQYVLLRDPIGNPLEAVICEELAEDQLPENLRVQVANQDPLMQGGVIDQDPFEKNEQKKHKIYTHIEWSESRVEWYQEYKNKEIDGTRGSTKKSTSPWLPLRMTHMSASSYGPGYIETACIADLQTAEALSQAVAEGALVSAQCKFLVKPSGVCNPKNLSEAPNGAYVPGNPDDVFPVQMGGKSSDLAVASQTLQQIEQRLAASFMLAEMRQAERVTAEEVRLQALQLENALGSVYANLTVDFQAPYISRKLELFARQGGMERLPEGLIKPVTSVGLAGVGRGNDLEKTARFMNILQTTIGPEAVAQYIKPPELLRRLASSMGISPVGLVKTEQEIAAEQQQAQQQAMEQQMLQSGMGDPQKLANAAATAQEMQQPPQEG